jgi:Fic family protein
LTNKGLLDVPILFLSRYILDHKDDYYSGLVGVSQRGNQYNKWYQREIIDAGLNYFFFPKQAKGIIRRICIFQNNNQPQD